MKTAVCLALTIILINCVNNQLTSSHISTLRSREYLQHNIYRSKHQSTSNITNDTKLETDAQAYADYLIDQPTVGVLNYSHAAWSGINGENIYWQKYTMSFNPYSSVFYNGYEASNSWYNGIFNYNFTTGANINTPGADTGLFTAMVWTTVNKVGCGYACREENYTRTGGIEMMWSVECYAVCKYLPTPNLGSKTAHVKPLI